MNRIDKNQLGVISWEEFEKAVKIILESAGASIKNFKVFGKKKFLSDDGEYEIDGSVEFSVLGANFFVIIECRSKKLKNKVKRDEVLAFNSKIESLKAQKGIFFTTSGYQKGAIQYATKHSIALVQVVNGNTLYVTKGIKENVPPPQWLKLPKYAGWLVDLNENRIMFSLIRPEIMKRLILTSKHKR